MCIEVDNSVKVELNDKGIGIGYKVHSITSTNKLFSPFIINSPLTRRKWLKAKKATKKQLGCSTNRKDQMGWHICLSLKGALIVKERLYHRTNIDFSSRNVMVINKVKFRTVISKGYWQGDSEVLNITAQEMLIMEEASMRNKYPGVCTDCGKDVGVGEGYFQRKLGRWIVRCMDCVIKGKLKKEKNLSGKQKEHLTN